jgi:hypothetical protein
MHTLDISINAWMIASREIFHISVKGLEFRTKPGDKCTIQSRKGRKDRRK